MFHHGRCGSSVLGDLLDQHSAVDWDGEVYNFKRKYWAELSEAERADPLGVLDKRMRKARKRFYGLELKYYHCRLIGLTLEQTVAELEARGFDRFVVLDRRNKLRKVVSSLVAAERGSARIPAGTAAPLLRVRIPVDAVPIDSSNKPLVELIREYEEDTRRIEQILAGKSVLRLRYEDDLEKDPMDAYRRTCAFLGIAPEAGEIRLGRTTPHPWRDVVENHEEVAAALAGTPFAWMAEEA
jgi:hypothetical protein